MIERRPFASLGAFDHGWLDARHHFSFADYRDPQRVHWGALRVWNDDAIAPGAGFPMHPHADMEIITYVRSGAITHHDSLGNRGRTQAGDVQVMSAGTGIRHAEANLENEVTRVFQIWIFPDHKGGAPSWGTRPFPRADRAGQFVALASGLPGDAGALPIRASARVLGAHVKAGQTLEYRLVPGHHAYLVPGAAVDLNGVELAARDGAAIRGEDVLRVTAAADGPDVELVLVETAR